MSIQSMGRLKAMPSVCMEKAEIQQCMQHGCQALIYKLISFTELLLLVCSTTNVDTTTVL